MLDSDSGQLEVSTRQLGDAIVVMPVGDIDLTASPSFRGELKKVLDQRKPRIIIDLTGVPYMDSSGVATLVEAMQLSRKAKIRLVLCCLQDRVRSIFEIAKLEMVFTITPTVDAAATA